MTWTRYIVNARRFGIQSLHEWLQGVRPQLGKLHQYPPRPLSLPDDCRPNDSTQDLPTISLVTPSLNQGLFLERTLRSVLDQNYPRSQYIVQDGGSTDDSRQIIERLSARLHAWHSKPDLGQSQAVNRGFALATGEIMAWLNADDLLLPGALLHVAGYFAEHPEVDVIYGQRIIIDENDREIGRWILPPHSGDALLWKDFIPQETLFWRRSIWRRAGGYVDEKLHFALDWDLLLRFHQAGARFVRLPRFLGAFRVHSNQKTSCRMEELGRKEIREVRRRYHRKSLSDNEIDRRVKSFLWRHWICQTLHRCGFVQY